MYDDGISGVIISWVFVRGGRILVRNMTDMKLIFSSQNILNRGLEFDHPYYTKNFAQTIQIYILKIKKWKKKTTNSVSTSTNIDYLHYMKWLVFFLSLLYFHSSSQFFSLSSVSTVIQFHIQLICDQQICNEIC